VNHYPTLLKREFWEYRGGLMWAPIWTAIVLVGFALFGWMAAEVWAHRASDHIHVGMDLSTFMNSISDEKVAELTRGFDVGLLGIGMPIRIVLFFVILSYCIGSLYNERRDRSILFWKSMPVSDTATVLSKFVTVALVAPLLAFAVTVLLQTTFLLIFALITAVHGGNPMRVVFGPAEPLALWLKLLANVPVTALWIMPSIGWLMFASSFARSKSFLWAVVPPIMLGVACNMTDVMQTFSLPSSWIWVHVVARAFPIGLRLSSLHREDVSVGGIHFNEDGPTLSWSNIGGTLADPETWIGVVVGAGLLAAAIHFRRNRELAD
jgi:ABC-2 type transport system permease protein